MNARWLTALLLVACACAGSQASAQTVIDEWSTVKVPAPPDLKPVKLDPMKTALLLLDFNGGKEASSGPCNEATKPRCLTSIPKVRALLDKARARGVLVIYSTSLSAQPGDIRREIAPKPGDPVVKSGPDKFIGTDLGELLARRQITTLIVTGTASEGAVLNTGTDAALHGKTIIVPVDTMSSTERYAEQYVAWHFTNAPGVAQKAVLTRSDMIDF